jgi:hypothetical protein
MPKAVQHQVSRRYALWRQNPRHPSLHFKQVKPGIWSVRVNDGYRALARLRQNELAWFWIGSHREYDKLIR